MTIFGTPNLVYEDIEQFFDSMQILWREYTWEFEHRKKMLNDTIEIHLITLIYG